jgi:hypothetical protein
MPESVTDRPTRSHEYLFLLTKSARYYYDAQAIAEPSVDPVATARRYEMPFNVGNKETAGGGRPNNASNTPGIKEFSGARNKRDVWTITTKPFKGAHFATMPPDLVEPCILAGTSEKGRCPECGAPWERVTERERYKTSDSKRYSGNGDRNDSEDGRYETVSTTTGWRPTCACGAGEPVPCVVLDPFAGAGTVPMVAERHGRRGIGIELSLEYCLMATERIYQDAPLWNGAK